MDQRTGSKAMDYSAKTAGLKFYNLSARWGHGMVYDTRRERLVRTTVRPAARPAQATLSTNCTGVPRPGAATEAFRTS